MKKLLSFFLMGALVAAVSCKKPDPEIPTPEPNGEEPEVVGENYVDIAYNLLSLSHDEVRTQLLEQGYTCVDDNQMSATDHSYSYQLREGNVVKNCAFVTRDGVVVAATCGEQWDYGYGQCADMRDRYVSLLALADHRYGPWSEMQATVNNASHSTMESLLAALRAFEFPQNGAGSDQLSSGAEMKGSQLVVRGAASIKNEQFLQWYTGPSYAITLLLTSYVE